MENDDWLKTLKDGDKIYLKYGGFGLDRLTPTTVTRITKTMIILGTGDRFRHNGSEIGGGPWSHGKWLLQNTPETEEEYVMQNLRNKLKGIISSFDVRIDYQSLTHEQINRIVPELTKIRDELIPPKGVVQK